MDKKLILDFDKKQKSLKHKRQKDPAKSLSHKTKQAKVEEPDLFQPSSSYRDRAKERREGLNKDFELDPDDLKVSNPVVGGQIGDDGEQLVDEAERRRQQIEDSKYLGGDVEHTHLVKGLDFALLEKVKNDQKLAEKLADDKNDDCDILFADNSDSDEEEFTKEALLAASVTTSSKRQLVDIEKLRKGKSTEIIPCRTAIARRVLNVLDEKWPNKSELFLPGRMSYVIPIDADADDQTVTTYLLSREDTSKQDDSEVLNESELALEQLINILARIRRGKASTSFSKLTTTTRRMRDLERDSSLNDYDY